MTEEDIKNNKNDVEFSEKDPLREEVKEIIAVAPVEKRTAKESVIHVLSNITVEPTMFFFVLASILNILTSQNLNLEKACRVNLNLSSEICDSLRSQNVDTQNEYERDTQKLITSAMAWKTYLTATIPCIIALFVGSWSDRTGRRKIFIIISIVGQILLCINGMINTYFFYELRMEHFVLSEGILEGFSGSWCLLFLMTFTYISAITTNENRTFRMGMINFSMTVGLPTGMSISGILLKTYGFYGCYGLACTMQVSNLIYNVFFLKDTVRIKDSTKEDGKGFLYFCRTFFDLTNLKITLGTICKKTSDNRRMRLIILLMVVAVLFGPMYGEISILYISTRYRFNWDEVKFSIFQTYNFIVHTVGTMFSLIVFSKHLKWHDATLGIISTVSKIAGSFVYCFATSEKIFFIAPLVEILNGTSFLALRSILSKLVNEDEFGKINSMFSLTENLMPLLYVPLYTKTYSATMEVLPGAVFLMGAAMTFPAVIVFCWLFYEQRRNLRKTRKTNYR
ncbi:lysosomal proton-coupled steroid conjugate and bile acid symporter SLC46A3-like [Battus philenor]|uniref:lysosomal proton-coupled steroid conjugate and bile acid symporter SLC46A3-like n=1 Tax=Battus philenor TaxID=42288 RepID=UPI0035CF3180